LSELSGGIVVSVVLLSVTFESAPALSIGVSVEVVALFSVVVEVVFVSAGVDVAFSSVFVPDDVGVESGVLLVGSAS
jgi:hypothetical protein